MGTTLVDNATFHLLMTEYFIPFYTQVSAGQDHTVLLRSDGRAVAFGANDLGMCSIPRLDDGVSYTQISGAFTHTVLLRSDGRAVACGENAAGKCDIPPLDGGMSYSQVSAGFHHTILLRSDGSVVGCGTDDYGECDIEPPEAGTWYVADVPCSRDAVLQAEFVCQDDAMLLVCSGLAGEEVLRFNAHLYDLAWNTHTRVALELNVPLTESSNSLA